MFLCCRVFGLGRLRRMCGGFFSVFGSWLVVGLVFFFWMRWMFCVFGGVVEYLRVV